MECNHNHRLLIVGNPEIIHIGAHILRAAQALGLPVELCDTRSAFNAAWPITKINWWLRGHRPSRLQQFGRNVVEVCRSFLPTLLLATGLAPLDVSALEDIGRLGIARLNYLTDDPWNPAHRTSWFFHALPLYDHVFSPRISNIEDLRELRCKQVSYLRFAYDPQIHFPEPPSNDKQINQYYSDVMFAGNADNNRVPYIGALIRAGFMIALYGSYWNRFAITSPYAKGHADMYTVRKAIGGTKVALCLVRRANRDGHVMRTFEVPAIGACMLTEDTEEHRKIFGDEGDAVLYFRDITEMIQKLQWLMEHDDEINRLGKAAHNLILSGKNTYKDRLITMLNL